MMKSPVDKQNSKYPVKALMETFKNLFYENINFKVYNKKPSLWDFNFFFNCKMYKVSW